MLDRLGLQFLHFFQYFRPKQGETPFLKHSPTTMNSVEYLGSNTSVENKSADSIQKSTMPLESAAKVHKSILGIQCYSLIVTRKVHNATKHSVWRGCHA